MMTIVINITTQKTKQKLYMCSGRGSEQQKNMCSRSI
jgi:hypothetical protein